MRVLTWPDLLLVVTVDENTINKQIGGGRSMLINQPSTRASYVMARDIHALPRLSDRFKWTDDRCCRRHTREFGIRCEVFFGKTEVSRWMTDKNLIEVTPKDVALHLNLIAWVYGVEGAEKYFNEIPKKLRTSFVYTTLLTCFANADCVEKAEAFMQKMKKLGLASYSAPYHVMLKLHWRKHNRDKLAAVVREMEENNVKYDGITYTILLNAYGSYRDIDGLESLRTKMESGPEHKTNWVTYVLVVRHFIEDQSVDKATELIKKAEKRILLDKDYESYWFIVYLYGAWGKKEEVSRVWEECKKRKVDNKHYMSVFPALLKLKDVEIAENIYKDWEDNSNLLKDIRIPNYMIKIYCKKWSDREGRVFNRENEVGKWGKL